MIINLCGYVKVTHVPDGEAPKWVREQWVGLLLPVVGLTTNVGLGVKTKKASDSEPAYMILQSDALIALRGRSRIAVAWFEDYGFPQGKKETFGFKIKHTQIVGALKSVQPNIRQFAGLAEVGVSTRDCQTNQRPN